VTVGVAEPVGGEEVGVIGASAVVEVPGQLGAALHRIGESPSGWFEVDFVGSRERHHAHVAHRAGDGNRTRVASLEGWSSTTELHPHVPVNRRRGGGIRTPGLLPPKQVL
jgi:hypothetical protein